MINPDRICYIFDVDGTLTEPRNKISKKVKKQFSKWGKNKQCFLATGSDFPKVQQQIGNETTSLFELIFCCMGNEIRNSQGQAVEKSNFIPPDILSIDLAKFMNESAFPYRTGKHFEVRTGMLNFSIVGRNATQKQREEYLDWDNINQERRKIAEFINNKYQNLEASVGGSISIDIIEKGKDKGQIIHYLKKKGAKKIVFVGDRCLPGGNDYGIVRELEKSDFAYEWYNVLGPNDTMRLIKENAVFNGGS